MSGQVDEVASALLFAAIVALFTAPSDGIGAWPRFAAQARERVCIVLVGTMFAPVAGSLAVLTALVDVGEGSGHRSRCRRRHPRR